MNKNNLNCYLKKESERNNSMPKKPKLKNKQNLNIPEPVTKVLKPNSILN